MSSSDEKTSWPELVGKTSAEAKTIIEQESQGKITIVQIMPPNSMMTMDYRTDRVRIHEDSEGKVATAPTIG